MIKDQDEYEEEEEVYYKNHFKEHMRWIPAIVKKKISGLRYLISLNGVIRMVHKNQIRKKDNRMNKNVIITPTSVNISHKRKRSESSPPPLRRSKRLEGQPRLKYPR